MKALLVFVGVLIFGIVLVAGSYVSANNYGARAETQIAAQWQDNQNVLSNYTNTIAELVQVPAMYRDDLQQVIKATFQGRYGADGSKAVVQWIKEQNLQFDPSMYTQIQQQIRAGRKDFESSQRTLLDEKREYQASLQYAWRGMWLRIAGFPKVNLDKYNIIVDDSVTQKFASGKDEALKLR